MPDEEEGGPGMSLSKEKACQMLEDGQANGEPLTPAQRHLFGMICAGKAPAKSKDGVTAVPRDFHADMMDAYA